MAKRRNVTDYSAGLYGQQLPLSRVSATRDFLKVSPVACKHWGSMECLTCPLQDWSGEKTPWCGAGECETCGERHSCCCGNEGLREKLWHCIRLWEQDRLKAKLGKEVGMKLASTLRA